MDDDQIQWAVEKLRKNRSQLLRVVESVDDFQMALSALAWFRELWDPDEKYVKLEIRRMRCFEAAVVISFFRPFAKARGHTVLSRKLIGVKFTDEEQAVYSKIEMARNKLIAHSDEESMNFRIDPFAIDSSSGEIQVPQFTFDDGLLFEYDELFLIADLLRRLMYGANLIIWEFAQRYPEELRFYKQPVESTHQVDTPGTP